MLHTLKDKNQSFKLCSKNIDWLTVTLLCSSEDLTAVSSLLKIESNNLQNNENLKTNISY